MDGQRGDDVTRLLAEWKNGNHAALDLLTPIIYDELHRLASISISGERNDLTLQPTALIHEAYIRLVQQGESNSNSDWQDRNHFFRVAARLMRQILVDHARKHRSQKRGSGAAKVSLDEQAVDFAPEHSATVMALDDALQTLETMDPRRAKIIELRYFGGFDVDETAQALGVSVATIGREQRLAQAWLLRELSGVPSA